MKKIQLREYQQQTIDKIVSQPKGSFMIVMATGLGKTVVFSHIPLNGKMLILSHREELVYQPIKYFDCACGVEKAEKHSNGEKVISASVQSLSKRLHLFKPDEFEIIVVDEAHHSAAKTYTDILTYFKPRLVLGFTATPNRPDGADLKKIFPEVIAKYNIKFGIENNYLTDIKSYRLYIGYDISNIRRKKDDLDQEQLAEAVDLDELNICVAKAYKERSKGPTLIFAASVKHAYHLADLIDGAVVVTGETKNRKAIIEDFANRKIPCLVNFGVFTEGTDLPMIETIILARPTCNHLLYTQMVGRGLRPYPGKEYLTLLDCVGITGNHNLCDDLSLFEISYLPPRIRREELQGMCLTDIEKRIQEEMARPLSLDEIILYVEPVDMFNLETIKETSNIYSVELPNGERVTSLGFGHMLRIMVPDYITGEREAVIYKDGQEIWRSERLEIKKLYKSIAKYLWKTSIGSTKYWSTKGVWAYRNREASSAQINKIHELMGKVQVDVPDITDNDGPLSMKDASDIITKLVYWTTFMKNR